MRRKPIVCLRSVAVVMLLLWTLMLGVNAEEAYTSWDTLNGKVSVYGRHMFEASRRISGTSLGLDFSLKGLEDIFCANDDKVYLLAGSEAAVVILDSDLNLESAKQRIFRMPVAFMWIRMDLFILRIPNGEGFLYWTETVWFTRLWNYRILT